MERIDQLNKTFNTKGVQIVSDALSWLDFQDFFSEEVNQFRYGFRKALEEKVKPLVPGLVERTEFPHFIFKVLKEFKTGEIYLSKPYGKGHDTKYLVAIILELARIDASLATAYMIQVVMAMNAIDEYGTTWQKNQLLEKMKNFEIVSGWALTERLTGSDASQIQTSCAKRNDGTWLINGDKAWIGLANKDQVILFAKDSYSKEVKGFIVDLTTKGISRKKIENKLALRPVHNMDIIFDNVIIDEKWRLPKVKDFKAVARMLAHSRMAVGWNAVGVGIGVYDNVIQYINQRKQFKKSLSQFQLVQDKLVRIMGAVQSSLCLIARLTELYMKDKITIGKLSMGKAWITKNIREATRLGRELLGANGIIIDNYVMKALVDMEVLYTYEGTYDINVLITGRELTGFSAFK